MLKQILTSLTKKNKRHEKVVEIKESTPIQELKITDFTGIELVQSYKRQDIEKRHDKGVNDSDELIKVKGKSKKQQLLAIFKMIDTQSMDGIHRKPSLNQMASRVDVGRDTCNKLYNQLIDLGWIIPLKDYLKDDDKIKNLHEFYIISNNEREIEDDENE